MTIGASSDSLREPDAPDQPPSGAPVGEYATGDGGGVGAAAGPPAAAGSASSVPHSPPVDGGITVDAALNNVTATNLQIIGDYKKVEQSFFPEEVLRFTIFSASMGYQVTADTETSFARDYLHEDAIIARYLAVLRDHRLLLLAGDRDTGKHALAQFLAHRLRSEDAQLSADTLYLPPLDTRVRIEPREVVREQACVAHRVICFRDALAHGNPDLRTFLRGLDEALLDALTHDLRRRHGYLLLTLDLPSLRRHLDVDLQGLRVYAPMPPATPTMLAEGLRRRLSEAGLSERLTEERRAAILARASSLSRLFRFIREYSAIVVDDQTLTIDEAFTRLDDVPLWFLQDVAGDFQSWSAGLVLTLLQCSPTTQRVPVVEFLAFRDALAPALHEIVGKTEDKTYKPEYVADDRVLRRTRSSIVRDPEDGRDVIAFEEPSYPERIWAALLSRSRGVLLALVPALEKMVESGPVIFRIRAARCLGRIGEIDPWAVTLRLVRTWGDSDSATTRAAVGHLYHGVLGSQDRAYQQRCLALLDDFARPQEREDVDRSEASNNVWTALAAYKQIGVVDLPLAMPRLREIAERLFAPRLGHLRDLVHEVAAIERAIRAQTKDQEVLVRRLVSREVLRGIGGRLHGEHRREFFALQFAIVSLCMSKGLVEVLQELRGWLRGSPGLQAVTTLLVLQRGGVANMLGERSLSVDAGGGRAGRATPLVIGLTAHRDGLAVIADFLEALYVSFSADRATGAASAMLPEMAEHLREAYWSHLHDWAIAALPSPDGRAGMEGLFSTLLASPQKEIRQRVLAMLAPTQRPEVDDSDWLTFATAVHRRHRRAAAAREQVAVLPGE